MTNGPTGLTRVGKGQGGQGRGTGSHALTLQAPGSAEWREGEREREREGERQRERERGRERERERGGEGEREPPEVTSEQAERSTSIQQSVQTDNQEHPHRAAWVVNKSQMGITGRTQTKGHK